MKTKGQPVLIDIQTKSGTLQAVSAHDLKSKHLKRMNTIVSTIEGKKKQKEVKHDLIGDLFYLRALTGVMDRTAYLNLNQKQRDKAIKHWWKASNAIHDMEKKLEEFFPESS